MTKPTILLIPGAWFHSSTYDDFLAHLQRKLFPTVYGSYPSLNASDPMNTDAISDTDHVLTHSLLPLVETEGKDVVIVMHSYGGVPGSGAAKGLAKGQRQEQGKKGGVVGLIYISGFVLPEGASVADGQGGQLPEWVMQDKPSPGLSLPKDPITVLSADIDPVRAEENASKLVPHATRAFLSPSPASAWAEPDFEGRIAYLVCTEDKAIPKFGQEAMMKGTGKSWITKEMNCSHNSPFLKMTEEAVDIVDHFVMGFLGLAA